MCEFTPEDLTNIMTACMTSKLRDGSDHWQVGLNRLCEMLRSVRDEASFQGENVVLTFKDELKNSTE